MQITITTEQLKTLKACANGIEAFRAMFGASGTVEWTREKQIEILLSPLGRHLGWAVYSGLLPLWAMNDARLDGASLDRASLAGASLVGASLVGASLDRASLAGASLVGARLDGARLDGARLVGASLDGASLVGASLVGASLVGARLDGARLDRANICPCNQSACVALRRVIETAGWSINPNGIVELAAKQAAV